MGSVKVDQTICGKLAYSGMANCLIMDMFIDLLLYIDLLFKYNWSWNCGGETEIGITTGVEAEPKVTAKNF